MIQVNYEEELEKLEKAIQDPTKKNAPQDMKNFIKKMETINQKNPTAENYVFIGRGYFELEQDPLAIESFNKAITLQPNNAAANYWRGLMGRYQQDPATSSKYIEKATALAPNVALYWYQLGLVYSIDSKDKVKGLKAFEECLKLDPKHSEAHYQVGSIAAGSQQNDKAIESYKKAVEFNPAYVDAYFNLGQLYQTTKQNEKAIENFLRVMQLSPYDWQSRCKLIQLNYALNREPEALQHRQILFENWRQGYIKAPRYCREQLDINGYYVIIYEYFTIEGQGPRPLKYDCHVSKDNKGLYRFSCGSDDFTNSLFMESGLGKPGRRIYNMDADYPGGLHKSFGNYSGEPSYKTLKDKLTEVVLGQAAVLSSSAPVMTGSGLGLEIYMPN